MITIFHGENSVDLENAIVEFKKAQKGNEIISLNVKGGDADEIKQAITSDSLFNEKRVVILRNFLSGKTTIPEKLLSEIKESANEILFVEDKELDSKTLTKFAKISKIVPYKPSPIIFYFLDSLGVKSAKECLILLHKALSIEKPEIILNLLQRRIRVLLALDLAKEETIGEVKKMAPWQISKLALQGKNLNDKKLILLHSELLSIEANLKKGIESRSVSDMLDIAITSQLK